MKKAPFLLLLFISSLGWGQTFDSVVDFELELSTLSDPAVAARAIQEGKIVILEGLLGDTVIRGSGAETQVWVSLIGGAWIGTDEVRSFGCRLIFRGESWLEVFPRPRLGIPVRITSLWAAVSSSRPASRILTKRPLLPIAEMVNFRVLD
jgi:hypothetical protein